MCSFKIIINLLNFILLSGTIAINSAPIDTAKTKTSAKSPALVSGKTPAQTITPVNSKTPNPPATPVAAITKAQITSAQIIPDHTLINTTKSKLMGATGNTFAPQDIYQTCNSWQDCKISASAWQILSAPPYNMTGFYCDTMYTTYDQQTNPAGVSLLNAYPDLQNVNLCSAGFATDGQFGVDTSFPALLDICTTNLNPTNITKLFLNNGIPLTLDVAHPSFNLLQLPISLNVSCILPALNANYFTNLIPPPNCLDAQTQFFSATDFGAFLECQAAYLVGSGGPCYFGTGAQCCYGNSANDTCNYSNGALWNHLALLLSGSSPLTFGASFNVSNGTILQPGIKIIASVCGTAPLTSSSPCYLDVQKIINPSNQQLIADIQAGNLTKVKADLQQSGSNLNIGDPQANFMTPLMMAAQSTVTTSDAITNLPVALEIVQYLVTLPNIKLNAVDASQHTALWHAQNSTTASTIKTAIIQTLINAPLSLDIAAGNVTNVVNDLKATSGIDLNFPGFNGQTPLMIAAQATNSSAVAIMNMLVQDPRIQACIKDHNGLTALNYAQKNSSSQGALLAEMISMIQIICDAANPDITLAEIQADIAAGNSSDAVMSNYVNSQNGNGTTTLMNVAQSTSPNALAIVQYLLTIPGININLTDNQGHTALWYAQNSLATPAIRLEIIKALDPAFNITAQLIYDITSNYNSNTIAYITTDLAAGASLTTPDSTGKSALMYTITNPGGANSTAAQALEIFNTVLATAVSQNLIQKNSNPQLSNIVAPMTVPILIYTLQNSGLAYIDQNTGMLQSLLQNPNIDVTAVDSTGANILILAAYANYTIPSTIGLAYQIVQFLLGVPAVVNNINATDNSGAGAYTWSQSSQSSWATEIQQAIAAAGGTT